MGGGAAEIAEVVSDVKERLPGLQPPPQLDSPEQSRFRLFDSIAAFLKTASQKQPLVLMLDDLHWADQPSLLLLQFVARELNGARLLVVGTYRDMELSRQHPLAESLGELTRERLFQWELLRGLSHDDVGRFIEVATGIVPPPGLIQAVYTQTEGNPLFVTEVVRLLVQEGELSLDRSGNRDSWTVRIPEGVREFIGWRLNRLSQRCNETLTIASVVGREFELGQLEPLVEDISEDRLLEVLEEALSARVIEELPQAVGRYQFTHALIQETLTQELSLTRRVRLHARIAEALEEIYGDKAEAHAAELAHHFAEAEAVLGTEKWVKYSLIAGDRAVAGYAWEEAQAQFQRGLAARGISPDGEDYLPDEDAAALLLGYGRACTGTAHRGGFQEAVNCVARAFDYYARVGDVTRAVEAALHEIPMVGARGGMMRIVREALAMVPADSLTVGRLLARDGAALGRVEVNYEAANGAFEQAMAFARNQGEAALEMNALGASADVDYFHNKLEECLSKSLKCVELAVRAGDVYGELRGRLTACRVFIQKGDNDAAHAQASAMLTSGERVQDRYWQVAGLQLNAWLARFHGDFAACRDFAERALAQAPQDGLSVYDLILIDYESGNFTQGEAHIDRLLDIVSQRKIVGGFASNAATTAIAMAARITGMVSSSM